MPATLAPPATRRVSRVALIGNPNSGKTTLFNALTGLNQRVGNFPGVTVDKKTGRCRLTPQHEADIIDLPGTYSLYPKSMDERVIIDLLYNRRGDQYPDFIIVTADASNLRRNLLLFTQLADLELPAVLVLTMTDVAQARGIVVDTEALSQAIGVPVVPLNARRSIGLTALKIVVAQNPPPSDQPPFYVIPDELLVHLRQIRYYFELKNDYLALLYAHQYRQLNFLSDDDRAYIAELNTRYGFKTIDQQAAETISRYQRINEILLETVRVERAERGESWSNRLDKVLTHRVWGYAIFVAVLLLLFQAVFTVAQVPMELIDKGVALLNSSIQNQFHGPLVDLLTNGVLAGLGGVLIFIPQIALLFLFIAVLEETGYMARVTFLMDRVMRPFGMSGKSVVPLISGAACAVPAVMAARTIESWKDRLITIFVTPLISCSARLPVFTILVALVVPDRRVLGLLNLRGLALMGLYALGFGAALFSGLILKWLLRRQGGRSYFIMEFPTYQWPRWKNVALTILEKVRTFVFEAGRVIVSISVILWVLATYGPGNRQAQAEARYRAGITAVSAAQVKVVPPTADEIESYVAALRLENSYAGVFGRAVEPVIRPLGFDWKIGIALLTSFAAREVFVGTMSTIYSVGQEAADDPLTIQQKLAEAKDDTGKPFFTPARAFSLLVFYVFAMQCMSTLAVVRRETKSWRWPLAQLIWMSGLAYVSALITYQVLR